jgi:hypothetical protein
VVTKASRHGSVAEAETSGSESEAQQVESSAQEIVQPENVIDDLGGVVSTIPFHARVPRTGPQTRTCYTIPGVPGCCVIHLSMFEDGVAPEFITLLGVRLAKAKASKSEMSAEKAAAAAVKAQEKLDKAQARIAAMATKAQEKLDKATAAAVAAAARVAAATPSA